MLSEFLAVEIQARRSVPLHSAVAGIVERQMGAGNGPWLIEGLQPGGPDRKRAWYVSKAFARYRASVGVTGRLRDFHALRSTFIAAMEGAEVLESTVKLLVGHKRHSMSYGHYSKGDRVDLRAAVDKLAYGPEVMRLLGEQPNISDRPRIRYKRVKRQAGAAGAAKTELPHDAGE